MSQHTIPNTLAAARQGRAAVRHLEQLIRTGTLVQDDGVRLVRKALAGFDAVLGPDAQPTPRAPELNVIDGGRA